MRAILVLFFLVCLTGSLHVHAQADDLIENKIPKHLPIKVEIIFDKNKQVLENAKIKVKNTGKRPIYYLDFHVSTPKDSGLSIRYSVAWLTFGRTELLTFGNLATPDDPALAPGEEILLEIGKKRAESFREAVRREGIVHEKYELIFQFLNFGDDSGFWTTGGVAFPAKKQPPKTREVSEKETPNLFSFFFDRSN